MKSKKVLITGASRGIGKACALAFADAGYYVFLNCRRSLDDLGQTARQILSKGGQCEVVPGDVSDPDDVDRIFDRIRGFCAGPDVLINNAGISYIGLLTDMSCEDWDRVLRTNLSSAFYCSRAAIPHMVSQKNGAIINISSMWGRVGASCEVAYSASKAGMNGLTMALAKELAPSNVQVNAIACGVIDTEMNSQLNEEERLALVNEIPAGRFGTPEEVAHLALRLSEGPEYLTGQVIGLDGGYI